MAIELRILEMLNQKNFSQILVYAWFSSLAITLVAAVLGENRAAEFLHLAMFTQVVDFVPSIAKFSAISAFPIYTKLAMAINWLFAALALMLWNIFHPFWSREGFQRLYRHLQTPQASPVRFVLGGFFISLMSLSDIFDLPFLSFFRGNWIFSGGKQPIQHLMDRSIFLTGIVHWVICAGLVILWQMSLVFTPFLCWRAAGGGSSLLHRKSE